MNSCSKQAKGVSLAGFSFFFFFYFIFFFIREVKNAEACVSVAMLMPGWALSQCIK